MASKQAHVSIRDALAADDRLSEFRHEVLSCMAGLKAAWAFAACSES